VYVLSAVAFLGATFGCIFAPNVSVLVAFRALQGAGGKHHAAWMLQRWLQPLHVMIVFLLDILQLALSIAFRALQGAGGERHAA
jgi:hypothetical protein